MSQLVTLPQARMQAQRLHHQKQQIVLVTGVFDLLHAEHKKFLAAAEQAGDALFVGVETDARVRQLKGPGRPVWPLAKRLKQLVKVSAVDYVFALPEQFNRKQDHERLIRLMKPAILAVSEHTPYQEVKRGLIEKYGGRLQVVLPHNPWISTSRLVNGPATKPLKNTP